VCAPKLSACHHLQGAPRVARRPRRVSRDEVGGSTPPLGSSAR
jgi:hypothetical protein